MLAAKVSLCGHSALCACSFTHLRHVAALVTLSNNAPDSVFGVTRDNCSAEFQPVSEVPTDDLRFRRSDTRSVPWHRRFVADLSAWKPGFDFKSVPLRDFCWTKWHWDRCLCQYHSTLLDIHLSTTEAILCLYLSASLRNTHSRPC